MTFNLRYSNPGDGANAWPLRKHRAAGIIRKHEPLIVGTQEGLLPMLEDLDAQLPEYGRVGTGREGHTEGEHCAIFYRKDALSVKKTGQFWLSEQPDVPASKSWDSSLPRICTWARFEWKDTPGSELLFYNTHLDHVGQTAREKGAVLIWQSLQKHVARTSLPAILTGDFNSYPDNAVVRFFRGETSIDGQTARLTDAYSLLPEVGRTAHSFQGGIEGQPPIDYIFVTPDVDLVSVTVDRSQIDGGYPSDHYPVVAQIRITV